MFTKSLEFTPGLTDFQIEYLRKHTDAKKAKKNTATANRWVRVLGVILLLTTCGLWAGIAQPEMSGAMANLTHFGVIVTILFQIFALFLIVVAMACVGGASMIRAHDEGESALIQDANVMMSYRDVFYSFRGSFGKNLYLLLFRLVNFAFLIGMVAQGYILAPLIMATTLIVAFWSTRAMRKKVIDSVKELSPQRVAELEAAFQRGEDAKEDAVDVAAAMKTIDVESTTGPYRYHFEGMDATGNEIKDSVMAHTEEEAQQKVRQMGYFVTAIRRVGGERTPGN